MPMLVWPPPSRPLPLHPEQLLVVPHVPTIWRQELFFACRGEEASPRLNIRVFLSSVTFVGSTSLAVSSTVTLLSVEQGRSRNFIVKMWSFYCPIVLLLFLLNFVGHTGSFIISSTNYNGACEFFLFCLRSGEGGSSRGRLLRLEPCGKSGIVSTGRSIDGPGLDTTIALLESRPSWIVLSTLDNSFNSWVRIKFPLEIRFAKPCSDGNKRWTS